MAKELVPAKTAKFRSVRDIMRDPNMKAKLSNLVDEAVKAKSKIQFEQQNIKALRDAAAEDLGLKPAIFNDFVSMTFNNDYVQRKDNLDEKLDLLELVMADANIEYAPSKDDNDE